jgi:hypothetical protein
MQQERRLPRFLARTALLLGLLTVVALAAGGRTPLGGDRADARQPPIAFWDYVFSTAVVLFVLAVPFTVWLFWISRSSRNPRTSQRRDVLVLIYVAIVCAGVVLASRLASDEAGRRLPTLPRVEAPRPSAGDEEQQRAPQFRWLPVIVFVGGAFLLVAYHRTRVRDRGFALVRSEDALIDEFAALLEDTLEDLRAEPDPRRAVISAYARMERVLAAFGFPRRSFEAPLEYLQRLAPDLEQLPGAARLVFELTHLYERARFSAHAIDAEMKESAIATLLSLRAELRGSVTTRGERPAGEGPW